MNGTKPVGGGSGDEQSDISGGDSEPTQLVSCVEVNDGCGCVWDCSSTSVLLNKGSWFSLSAVGSTICCLDESVMGTTTSFRERVTTLLDGEVTTLLDAIFWEALDGVTAASGCACLEEIVA